MIAKRAGKAIRSPAKDVMLAAAAAAVGRGKGFGVHEALDQIGAMGVDAVAALASGWLYDQAGYRVLAAVPVLSTLALLAFATSTGAAITGVLIWGAVLGIQESTMRAAVADLVPAGRRGSAYGIFAAGFGTAIRRTRGVRTSRSPEHEVTRVEGGWPHAE